MKTRSLSYPDRIRRIAEDLNRLRNQYEVAHTVEKLRAIANELERKLNQNISKKV